MIIHGVDVKHHDFTDAVTIEIELEEEVLDTVDEIERLCTAHGFTIDDFFASALESYIDKYHKKNELTKG